MVSDKTLESLSDIMAREGPYFFVEDIRTGEIVQATFLFSNMFGLKNEDGYSYFAAGDKRAFVFIKSRVEKENGVISPEEQKKARELERQKTNQRITRELKMKKGWDDKFKNTIKKQTTKKQSPFTVIEGGKK